MGYTFYSGKDFLLIVRFRILHLPQMLKLSLMFSNFCTVKRGLMSRNASYKSDKDRYTLQKEVLEALFTVPERSEEVPEKIIPVRNVRRSRGFGRVVVGPLKDTTIEHKTVIAKLLVTEDGKQFYVYLNTFFCDIIFKEIAENVEVMIIVCLFCLF